MALISVWPLDFDGRLLVLHRGLTGKTAPLSGCRTPSSFGELTLTSLSEGIVSAFGAAGEEWLEVDVLLKGISEAIE